jgi:[acyl-carrier-protein] S-malonyltransferase
MSRAAIVCPGRGSYTERSLGSLPAGHEFVERADVLRAEYDLPGCRELDAATKFQSSLHLRPANVSALIYLVSMIDGQQAKAEHEVCAIAGNSMGWYTALAMGGALSFEDGFRLVQEMALLQEQHDVGGQILYPLVDEDWRVDATAVEAVMGLLAAHPGELFPSIKLGGYAVLAGTEAGIRAALDALPKLQLGGTPYPFRLMRHGPYHTPLLEPVAEEAAQQLGRLEFRAPDIPLIDGRGRRHTPWNTSPAALASYTLGDQVVEPYDLSSSLFVMLREHAPERIVLPGPGNTLGGVVGQVLVAEGWRGVASKADFGALQQGDRPLVISMRR